MTKDPSLSQDASEILQSEKRTMFQEFWSNSGSLASSPRVRRLSPWSAWFVPKISFVSTLLLTLLELPENGPDDSWSRSGNTWLWSNDLFGWQYCTWNLLFALFWMEPSFGIFQRSLWGHNLFIFQKLFIIDSKWIFCFCSFRMLLVIRLLGTDLETIVRINFVIPEIGGDGWQAGSQIVCIHN